MSKTTLKGQEKWLQIAGDWNHSDRGNTYMRGPNPREPNVLCTMHVAVWNSRVLKNTQSILAELYFMLFYFIISLKIKPSVRTCTCYHYLGKILAQLQKYSRSSMSDRSRKRPAPITTKILNPRLNSHSNSVMTSSRKRPSLVSDQLH